VKKKLSEEGGSKRREDCYLQGFGATLKFPGSVRRCCEEDLRNCNDGSSSNKNIRGMVRRQLQ